jgi:hypothetical protein
MVFFFNRKSKDIRYQVRKSVTHGFQQGNGKAFMKGGQHKQTGMGIKLGQGLARNKPAQNDPAVMLHPFCKLPVITGFIMGVSGNDQLLIRFNPVKGIHKHIQPFFRFNPGHCKHIAGFNTKAFQKIRSRARGTMRPGPMAWM